MERLIFADNLDSIHRLDEIMYSYQGWDRGSVLGDDRSLTVLLFLLRHGAVLVTEHTYSYNYSIRDDAEMMTAYDALAAQTRWRRFQYTEVESIRVNALKQMRQVGIPFYDDYICYQNGQINVHCGNIGPRELLTHLAEHQELKRFYIFAYPYWTEDRTAKFFCFEFSDGAHRVAVKYREMMWEMMCGSVRGSSPCPPEFPTTENKPTE